MKSLNSLFVLGDIVETIFPKFSDEISFEIMTNDESFDIVDFSVDNKGRIRKATGFVAFDATSDENMDYLPRYRFEIKQGPWNSHSLYFEIDLPNPAENSEHYQFIRTVMLSELNKRLSRHKKNAQARLKRKMNKVA